MEPHIRHEQNVRTGIFYLIHQCERMAFLSYFENPEGVLMLNHTYVSPDLRGQNIASKLVEAAVSYARKHHLKLIPVCPYVVKWFEKHAEEKEMLFQQN
ncbi:MAG: GNAT family N-acetyltransferase [Bacteroidales bacterium]|nr:GNAT family N-acetyltransferase [Bacteroidales bacterium]